MLLALILFAHTLTPIQGAGGSPPPTAGADSLSIGAVFAATGGRVTTGGAFTAGANAGTFRITATSGAQSDTSTVTVTAPPAGIFPETAAAPAAGASRGVGIRFGPAGGLNATLPTGLFDLSIDSHNASNLLSRLAAARAKALRLFLNLTGGAHANYKTDGMFDMAKWQAKMDTYNTPAITAAVAMAVADGTVLGNSVMDEPANVSEGSSWGPAGTMNKARVDSMAAYARTIFPTLPMGVALDYRIWPEQSFRNLDFLISQYRASKGPVAAYRDGALALGQRDGHAIAFSLNILDGGKRAATCPVPETGGAGTYGRNCRMTAEQVLEYGRILGPAGCAFLMWRYDPAFMAQPENHQAFDELARRLAAASAQSCRRA